MSNCSILWLIIGLFIGAAIGVFATSLAVASRDNVTITYSGYQPKQESENSIPPSTGSPVDKSCIQCNGKYAVEGCKGCNKKYQRMYT